MGVPRQKANYSYEEYLALEASSNVKHEFFAGEINAMAGGTPEHASLQLAAGVLLVPQLRGGPCHGYGSDLRVLTPSGLATYPDLTFVCGPSDRDPADRNAITNPVLLIEVLSRSTEGYDSSEKFEHYKTLRSLRQYVLVSHREHSIVVWTRGDDGTWQAATVREGEIAELPSIAARLDVRELYALASEPSR